ncbi:nucleoside hydrolase [Aureivirga marina]|uniref:nucleoside hydrolase n=1 Tax=Aureivirga marina TaxID=1182451 RepID=UPI0018CAEA2B|nr:nucleoside hydrolase [Aureivirga marina]
MSEKKDIIIIHDGATDELMSILFAASMPNINIKGIMVVNADCQGYPTAKVCSKILDLISLKHIPVVVSGARGWNPFPWTYRQYSLMVNVLPIINQFKKNIKVPEPQMEYPLIDMVNKVYKENNQKPITLLCLSPVTDIANAIKSDATFRDKIHEIVWMGGVYINQETPAGNIDTGIAPGANPNAEWNVYWDPKAAKDVITSGINLKMFPLNVTNNVTLSTEIIRKHFLPESGKYPALSLATQMYSLVAFQYGFSFWDTAATAYLGKPDLYSFQQAFVSVDISPDPETQGTMHVELIPDIEPLETTVQIATKIKVEDFYNYYVTQLKKLNFKS